MNKVKIISCFIWIICLLFLINSPAITRFFQEGLTPAGAVILVILIVALLVPANIILGIKQYINDLGRKLFS